MSDENAPQSTLRVEPEAASAFARACATLLGSLREIQQKSDILATAEGYGTLPSAIELAGKFAQMGGGPDGAQARLRAHVDIVMRIEAVLKKSFEDYDEADQQFMTELMTAGGTAAA